MNGHSLVIQRRTGSAGLMRAKRRAHTLTRVAVSAGSVGQAMLDCLLSLSVKKTDINTFSERTISPGCEVAYLDRTGVEHI